MRNDYLRATRCSGTQDYKRQAKESKQQVVAARRIIRECRTTWNVQDFPDVTIGGNVVTGTWATALLFGVSSAMLGVSGFESSSQASYHRGVTQVGICWGCARAVPLRCDQECRKKIHTLDEVSRTWNRQMLMLGRFRHRHACKMLSSLVNKFKVGGRYHYYHREASRSSALQYIHRQVFDLSSYWNAGNFSDPKFLFRATASMDHTCTPDGDPRRQDGKISRYFLWSSIGSRLHRRRVYCCWKRKGCSCQDSGGRITGQERLLCISTDVCIVVTLILFNLAPPPLPRVFIFWFLLYGSSLRSKRKGCS